MNWRYLVRRLCQVVPTVAAILVIAFLMSRAIPGDPAEVLAGEGADAAQIAASRHELGLDRPLVVQLVAYAGDIAHGDLGTSDVLHVPVWDLIRVRLPATLLLMVTALVLSTTVGIGLGCLAARRPFGWADLGLNTLALAGYAFPVFWLAQVVVLVFALHLGLFPAIGMADAGSGFTGISHVVDVARHLVLPAAVLAASEVALLTRITRTGLLGELGKDYVRAARARGAGTEFVFRRHALPNAILPVITVIGGRVGGLVSGTILVENVFAWPGLGRLLVDSAQSRDYPVVLGLVLLATGSVVVANLVTDLVYASVDRRIQYR